MKDVTAVILAAGESKRMRSSLSKLLHSIGHRSLVEFPVESCVKSGIGRIIVVVGHQSEKIKSILGEGFEYVYQEKRLGTGDAVRKAVPLLKNIKGELVVLPGDAPFITPSVLKELVYHQRGERPAATVLTAILPDPGYYGRIVRNGYESVKKIVESRNASLQELQIKEINSGIYCFDPQKLLPALFHLKPNQLSKEYYLTDVIELFFQQGFRVEALRADDPWIAMGVNTPEELKRACEILKIRSTSLATKSPRHKGVI